ncbi:MAG: hypothetical protein JXA52_03120 [Planctomycetes bacterium]|nr:hypothetical protein [Planctomycetota bacterium]
MTENHNHNPAEPPLEKNRYQEAQEQASQSLSDALQTSFSVLRIGMVLVIIFFFLRGFFVVSPGTVVLKTRFGAYIREEGKVKEYTEGGLYYAIPLLEKMEVIDLTSKTIKLAKEFTVPEDFQKRFREYELGDLRPGIDGYTITGDTNILHTVWELEYRVTDPYRYRVSFQEKDTGERNLQTGQPVYRSGPEQLLREAFRNAVVRVSAGIAIDDALTNRNYQSRILSLTQKNLWQYDCGIELVEVRNESAKPPQPTEAAFNAVTQAKSIKETMKSNAEGDARTILEKAKGRANAIIHEAESYKTEIVESARSDAQVIFDLLQKFPNDSQGLNIYLQQYHQEILAEILQKTKVRIVRPGPTWYMTGPPLEELSGLMEATK